LSGKNLIWTYRFFTPRCYAQKDNALGFKGGGLVAASPPPSPLLKKHTQIEVFLIPRFAGEESHAFSRTIVIKILM
jgi:hypothetical protein